MTNEELLDMLIDIQGRKCETQMLEIKAAEKDAPRDCMTRSPAFLIRMTEERLSLGLMKNAISMSVEFMILRTYRRKLMNSACK